MMKREELTKLCMWSEDIMKSSPKTKADISGDRVIFVPKDSSLIEYIQQIPTSILKLAKIINMLEDEVYHWKGKFLQLEEQMKNAPKTPARRTKKTEETTSD